MGFVGVSVVRYLGFFWLVWFFCFRVLVFCESLAYFELLFSFLDFLWSFEFEVSSYFLILVLDLGFSRVRHADGGRS